MEHYHYELSLATNDVRHRATIFRRPQTNGFVKRFHRTILDKFFRLKLRETTLIETVEALQADLGEWLQYISMGDLTCGIAIRGNVPGRPYHNLLG